MYLDANLSYGYKLEECQTFFPWNIGCVGIITLLFREL